MEVKEEIKEPKSGINKTAILVVLVLGLSVVGYGYMSISYKKETAASTQADIQMKEKCKVVGEEIHKAQWEGLVHSGYADSMVGPEYTYNKELNTCLYSGGYRKGDDWYRWVKDGFTNEDIITLSRTVEFIKTEEDEERFLKNAEAYWEKHAELFGE